MDFFDRQDQTRRVSRWLVLLFLLAVAAIVVTTTLLVLFVFGRPPDPGIGLFSPDNLQRQSGLIITTAIGVAGVMFLASLFRSMSLRGGGGQVARQLGGQRLDADTRDPKLRQLQNVIEEIALAAGVPVPEIYVLEQEAGINAFAAGYSPADAAIAVTRGTLDKLDRDELQGVIAHEFSHILNGDMRLNIRLMGLVFGILVLAIVGQRILGGAFLFGGGRRRDNSAGAILAVGIGLLAIGYIGLFFGRWIKAAVARQRESLADASAVQFTRQPEGIAGALKKIAVYSDGSLLQANSEEVNHMLFGEGSARSMFATHPPLPERIRALDPTFTEDDLKTLAARLQREAEQGATQQTQTSAPKSGGGTPFDADNLIDRIGQMDGQTLAAAAALSGSLPGDLLQAARSTESAPTLILFLLLDSNDEVRSQQLQVIRNHTGAEGEQRVLDLMAAYGPPAPEHHLPLLDAALPGLKRRSATQLKAFDELVQTLSEADHRISTFEFLLAQILRSYIRDSRDPHAAGHNGRASLEPNHEAAATTLAALAHFGNPGNRDAAQAAFAAGAARLRITLETSWSDAPGWAKTLRAALERLDQLVAGHKRALIQAWTATVLHDDKATTAELELLRALCLSIHVPMPPLDVQQ